MTHRAIQGADIPLSSGIGDIHSFRPKRKMEKTISQRTLAWLKKIHPRDIRTPRLPCVVALRVKRRNEKQQRR